MKKSAAEYLEGMISAGRFNSTLDQYIEREIKNGRPDNFYNQAMLRGKAQAEQELDHWLKHFYRTEFANAMTPIAQGIYDLALSQKTTKAVKLIDPVQDENMFPFFRQSRGQKKMIVVNNPQHNGCGCTLPEGSDVFWVQGNLQLKAINIYFDEATVLIGLVFPLINDVFHPTPDLSKYGFVRLSIDTDGREYQDMFTPRFDPQGLFEYLTGERKKEQLFCLNCRSGGNNLGFPGALEYIAKHIHLLGPFLTGMSKEHVAH